MKRRSLLQVLGLVLPVASIIPTSAIAKSNKDAVKMPPEAGIRIVECGNPYAKSLFIPPLIEQPSDYPMEISLERLEERAQYLKAKSKYYKANPHHIEASEPSPFWDSLVAVKGSDPPMFKPVWKVGN